MYWSNEGNELDEVDELIDVDEPHEVDEINELDEVESAWTVSEWSTSFLKFEVLHSLTRVK